ncbi:hypothetical protein TrCOL_g7034 [Triparma columacea]|uniref:Uncharacterized protein n=1 Tax=Triparma columacea TaxID=722753 RepID=A0A9W7G130_9STRA|nr:hypothetical protein TrCOL_g7034 [Triparma columacea]
MGSLCLAASNLDASRPSFPRILTLNVVAVDFCFAAVWPGLVKVISLSSPALPPSSIGTAVTGGRLGTASSFLAWTAWLETRERMGGGKAKEGWQIMFGTLGAAAALGSALLKAAATRLTNTGTANDDDKGDLKHRASGTPPASVMSTVLTLRYLLLTISRTLLMLYSTFLVFLPTFLSSSTLTPPQRGIVSSCYSLGTLASVKYFTSTWSKVEGGTTKDANTCKATAVAMAAPPLLALAIINRSTGPTGSMVTFVTLAITMSAWGGLFVPGFFLAPVTFGVRGGRKENVGRVENFCDAVAYGVMAIGFGVVGKKGGKGEWGEVMAATAAAGVLGGWAAGKAMEIDERMERKGGEVA